MFLSPASEIQLKTHNLVNKHLSLCHNSSGVETPMHSPWGLTQKELLSGAHNSLRSSLTAFPKQQELNLLLGDKTGIQKRPLGPQSSYLTEAQSRVARVPR